MTWSKTKIAVVSIVTLLLLNAGVVVTVSLLNHRPNRIASNPLAPDGQAFTSLFNGQDLEGWTYDPQVWSVSNGIITGRAAPGSQQTVHYLAWAGGDVDNFELRLKVRTSANENSGVAVRARYPQQRWMPGYQAEIHGPRTGLLIIAGAGNERQLSRAGWMTSARQQNGADVLVSAETLPEADRIAAVTAAVTQGEWCDFTVLVDGTRFVIQVNGVTITDSRDEHPTKFVATGKLGLEYSHQLGMDDGVEFKNIQLKRLPR